MYKKSNKRACKKKLIVKLYIDKIYVHGEKEEDNETGDWKFLREGYCIR